jgi:hypothetical protein
MLPVCLELWVSKGIMASNNWCCMQGRRGRQMLSVCLELWVSKGIMASNNWYRMQGYTVTRPTVDFRTYNRMMQDRTVN